LHPVFAAGKLAAYEILKDTWVAFDHQTGIVEKIFYGKPNGHGWSPSKAHAQSYVLRKDTSWSPCDLDEIP
jgi:hypothetical protein